MDNDQQNFWAGEFGNSYISRNQSEEFLASNLHLFSRVFSKFGHSPESFIEFGANIGMNAKALKLLFPNSHYCGVEVNAEAYRQLAELADLAVHSSIETYNLEKTYEVSFTKGVLIHLNPNNLNTAYEKLYHSSSKYILIAEYYNPTPVGITYRGFSDKLFKRDFASEILSIYADLRIIDYGFVFHEGAFPQDDITWFLLEKS